MQRRAREAEQARENAKPSAHVDALVAQCRTLTALSSAKAGPSILTHTHTHTHYPRIGKWAHNIHT
jgi:hypothetical protein